MVFRWWSHLCSGFHATTCTSHRSLWGPPPMDSSPIWAIGKPAVLKPDPLDVAYLPLVGEVYIIRTVIVQPPDKHDTRPVVVVASPANLLGRISLVCRTTDTSAKGVSHARNRHLGLNKDGVFCRLTSTEAQLWTPRNVTLLGSLEPENLAPVVDRFWT